MWVFYTYIYVFSYATTYVCIHSRGIWGNNVWVPHTELSAATSGVQNKKKITRQDFQSQKWRTILLQMNVPNWNKCWSKYQKFWVKALKKCKSSGNFKGKDPARREAWSKPHKEKLSYLKHLLVHKQWPKGWATEQSAGLRNKNGNSEPTKDKGLWGNTPVRLQYKCWN